LNVKFLILDLRKQEFVEAFEIKLRDYLEKGWVVEDTFDMEGAIVFYLITLGTKV